MKLNFWQWLGVVLLVIGIFLYARKTSRKADQSALPQNSPPAATTPATPATTPAAG